MKKHLFYFVLACLCTCMSSCQTDVLLLSHEDVVVSGENNADQCITTEGQTILGDYLEIPYSIENLNKAYHLLPAETKAQINIESIMPTHYYVRFSPKNLDELLLLESFEPRLILSEIPYDREVLVGGASYHDPSLPSNVPTYQYSTIPTSIWSSLSSLPVRSEILIEAFIPDYDEQATKSSPSFSYEAYQKLLKEAYRITGQAYPILPETKASEWHPSGIIRSYDDEMNAYLPVPGVRIRGRHLLKVHETLTDENGYFRMASFNNPASLSIIWESERWDMKDGSIDQASYNGPTLSGQSWIFDIGPEHEKNVRYAAIQRAAYRYIYGDCGDLSQAMLFYKINVYVHDDHGRGNFDTSPVRNPWISLYLKDSDNSYRMTNDMFYYAAHEFAHAAHCARIGQDSYRSMGDHNPLKESWAVFVGNCLHELEYGSIAVDYQAWPYASDNYEYSPLFIDLVDTFNQHTQNSQCPDDQVSGYSWYTLNRILGESMTVASLKSGLKQSLPQGVSANQIDLLFSTYEQIWQSNGLI